MRTQAEWNVEANTSSPSSPPSIRRRRSFSSPAALLVKVMAITFQLRTASFRSIPSSHDGASVPVMMAVRRAFTSSSVTSRGVHLEPWAEPKRMRLAMRLTSTVVFPLPAPARMSRGPLVVNTASRCISFRRPNCFSIYVSRKAQNCCARSVAIVSPVLFNHFWIYHLKYSISHFKKVVHKNNANKNRPTAVNTTMERRSQEMLSRRC